MTDLLWQELENMGNFLALGGPVMWLIIACAGGIGFLVTERYWYLLRVFPGEMAGHRRTWREVYSTSPMLAQRVERAVVSEARIGLNRHLPLLKTLVAVCPLLGLLGTVTGMMQVFDTVAAVGTGDPRAMASGISRATLPTMAGMVVALPGLYLCLQLDHHFRRTIQTFRDHLRPREGDSA